MQTSFTHPDYIADKIRRMQLLFDVVVPNYQSLQKITVLTGLKEYLSCKWGIECIAHNGWKSTIFVDSELTKPEEIQEICQSFVYLHQRSLTL